MPMRTLGQFFLLHILYLHVFGGMDLHQVAYFDMTTRVLTAVGKLVYSIFYSCLVNVKSER